MRRMTGVLGVAMTVLVASALVMVGTVSSAGAATSVDANTTTHGLYNGGGGRLPLHAGIAGPAKRANAVVPSGFSIVPSPSPSTLYNELDQTSCASATFCIAVGFQVNSLH